MSNFTARTTGALVGAAPRSGLTKSNLATLLQQTGWEVTVSDSINKEELVRKPLDAARRRAAAGNEAEHRMLIDFTCRFVEAMRPRDRDEMIEELRSAFSSIGYELDIKARDQFDETVTCRLLPTEPGATPLEPEITALEAELSKRGYTTACERYRDAVDNLVDLKFSDANSALRAALESLVTELAVDHTMYVKPPQANTGMSAIKALSDMGTTKQGPSDPGLPLPKDEGGEMLHGIWSILHANGSHPGSSDAQEARLRLQLVTGLAQFLLRHFPSQS